MQEVEVRPALGLCVECGTEFPFRGNKKFCSPRCRVYANRPAQNASESHEKYWDNKRLYDLNWRLAELYYNTPPSGRPEFLVDLMRQAFDGNGDVKEVLTNRIFMLADHARDKWACWKSQPTLAQEAHRLCMGILGFGICKLLKGSPEGLRPLEEASKDQLVDALRYPPVEPCPVVFVEQSRMGSLALQAFTGAMQSKGVKVLVYKKRNTTE